MVQRRHRRGPLNPLLSTSHPVLEPKLEVAPCLPCVLRWTTVEVLSLRSKRMIAGVHGLDKPLVLSGPSSPAPCLHAPPCCVHKSPNTLEILSQSPSVAEAAGPSGATRTGPMRLACQGIRHQACSTQGDSKKPKRTRFPSRLKIFTARR